MRWRLARQRGGLRETEREMESGNRSSWGRGGKTYTLVLLLGVIDLVALANVLGLPWRQHGHRTRHGARHGLQRRLASCSSTSSTAGLAHIVTRYGTTSQIVWLWYIAHGGGMQIDHATLAVQTGLALRARTLGGHIAFPASKEQLVGLTPYSPRLYLLAIACSCIACAGQQATSLCTARWLGRSQQLWTLQRHGTLLLAMTAPAFVSLRWLRL